MCVCVLYEGITYTLGLNVQLDLYSCLKRQAAKTITIYPYASTTPLCLLVCKDTVLVLTKCGYLSAVVKVNLMSHKHTHTQARMYHIRFNYFNQFCFITFQLIELYHGNKNKLSKQFKTIFLYRRFLRACQVICSLLRN